MTILLRRYTITALVWVKLIGLNRWWKSKGRIKLEQITALNNIYGSLYIMSALYFIGASFLLWVGMRITSVLTERGDVPLANKILASLFGLSVTWLFVNVASQGANFARNHAFEMKAAAESTGFELNATSQQFIETMNVSSLPEPSIMANPVGVVIGLIALVIIIVPLWANQNNT